jgi:hypothetical protein
MTITYKTSEGRGHWVKNGCYYEMNAIECPTDEQSYIISITKDDNRWNVFAEDHEPEDLDNHFKNGFKTLTEAKAFAEDFAEYFEHCQDEIAKSEVEEDVITGYIVANDFGQAITQVFGTTFIYGAIANAIKFELGSASDWIRELGEDWFMQAV